MSLPKETTSHSLSPPKLAFRTTGDSGKPTSARSLTPSPRVDHHLATRQHDYEHSVKAEDGTSPTPTFQPFFTLIEDPAANEHHHPTVHYIFADDDTDIITEAACRSLAQDDPSQEPLASASRDPWEEESKLPALEPEVREHYLILDGQPREAASHGESTWYEVTAAHSFSSEWQILNATISEAPTIDAAGAIGAEGEGLMLKIEGRRAPREMEGKGKQEKESLDEMIKRFEEGLADIKKAIEGGIGAGGKSEPRSGQFEE